MTRRGIMTRRVTMPRRVCICLYAFHSPGTAEHYVLLLEPTCDWLNVIKFWMQKAGDVGACLDGPLDACLFDHIAWYTEDMPAVVEANYAGEILGARIDNADFEPCVIVVTNDEWERLMANACGISEGMVWADYDGVRWHFQGYTSAREFVSTRLDVDTIRAAQRVKV